DNVWSGRGNCTSNGLPWSRNLVESLTYTNSSLYNAIKHSIENPEDVTFSPISGMHHARPNEGSGFCTFSGQVISSIKIFEEFGKVGAYFDLDGHFGNSIEDSRSYVKNLNRAIPIGCNVNPSGKNEDYNKDFDEALTRIGYDIIRGRIHYVVFAHGADSHADDDLGGKCDTKYWLKNAELFANWVNEVSTFMGKPLPVTLALFGGYRKDDYDSVLNLHLKSLIKISNIICGNNFEDNLQVKEKQKIVYNDKTWRGNFIKRKNNKRLELFGTI
ncbi:MAG TPA: hypothetical protein PKI46_04370, partial [Bacteroidales bacterium]|nr:hypothetical protein [Bacteroidales bacterium]